MSKNLPETSASPARSAPPPLQVFVCGVDCTGIVRLLLEVYSLDEAWRWMQHPHPHLGGRSAAELIARGEHDEVEAVVFRLLDGAFV